MANTISLSIDVSIDDIGTLNDDTTFSSPARSGVGVFVQGFKVNAASVLTEIVLESDTSDPETDASWTFDISTDGWYQFPYASIPDYAGGTTYAQYDAAFDPVTNLVYTSVVAGNIGNALTDELYWELVDEPASLAFNEGEDNESANIDSAVYNRILMPKVDRLYGDKAVQVAKECCGDCERPENVDIFELVFALKEGAMISEERSEFADGEKIIRRLDEFLQA